jgi:putative alpha-1,2-mannosidase
MGTDSKPSLSNGNTYPAIAVPWGMNIWAPQTGNMGNGWSYTYASDKIRGFKQTHQPSPWMNDYGQFSIMPVTQHIKFRQDDRPAGIRINPSKTLHIAFVELMLPRNNSNGTACQFRFTYPPTDSSFIVIDALTEDHL